MKKIFTFFISIFMLFCLPYYTNGQSDAVVPEVLDFQVDFSEDEAPDSVNISLRVTYSEAVQVTDTFNVVIRFYSGVWEEYYVFSNTEAVVNDKVVTLTPSRAFLLSGRYNLIIDAGSVLDMAGNSAGALYHTFVANANSPIVRDSDVTLTFNDAKDSVSAIFTVTYNEDVQLSNNFRVTTHVFRNGVWDEEYDVYDETEISIVDSVVTITPSQMFSAIERYQLVIAYASITDLQGNISASFTENFQGDETAPELTDFVTNFSDSSNPDSLQASFTLTYNENVMLDDSIQIFTYQKSALGQWEEYEALNKPGVLVSGNTVTVNPTKRFMETGSYEFVLIAGSIRDLAGNPAATFTEVFLRDSIPPKLINISPNLSLPVPPNSDFVFTFDEKVRLIDDFIFHTYQWNEDSAKYIVYEELDASNVTVDDSVIIFNPSLDFNPLTRAQIVLTGGSVRDIEGNKFLNVTEGDTLTYVSERFWTAESGAAMVSFLPANGDSLDFLPDALTITFSEKVMSADTASVDSSNISSSVYLRTDGLDIEHVAVLDSASRMIIIEPFMDLSYGTTYTYGFTNGLVNEAGDTIPAMEATFTIIDSSEVVNQYAIAEINGDSLVSPYLGQVVQITGTITGIHPDEGFYVQDDNVARSGIWIAFSDSLELEVNDGVQVTGTVEELNGMTSINASLISPVAAPITVEPVVVNFGTDSIPMYYGIVVQILNAQASSAGAEGEWNLFAEGDADSVIVGNRFFTYTPVQENMYNLTGIVTFRDSVYRIEPRFEADVTDVTDPTSVDLTPENAFSVYPNPFDTYIKISNNDKLTRVIISNITGQRVMDIRYPQAEINTSQLMNGVYIISLLNENNLIKSSRIIKR